MLLVLLALLGTPSPAPSASPQPVLKTIVTVKSSAICTGFAEDVNAAVGADLANDQRLGNTITALSSRDIGTSEISRNAELQHLEWLADAMYRDYRNGEADVARLRDLAAKATDPKEKADITAAADALGGALYRQHLMQRDLDGFVAYLEAGDMRRGLVSDMPGSGLENSLDVRRPSGAEAESVRGWLPPRAGLDPAPGSESFADDETMSANAAKEIGRAHV